MGWRHSRSLLTYLRSHQMDPDNALIGLSPSRYIETRYKEWKDAKISPSQQPSSPRNAGSLHCLGFAGRKGDLVVTPLPPSLQQEKALRNRTREANGGSQFVGLVIGRVSDAMQCNGVTFAELYVTPNEKSKVSIPASQVVTLETLLPKGTDLRKEGTVARVAQNPSEQCMTMVRQQMVGRLEEMLQDYEIPILPLYQALQEGTVPFTWYHSLRKAAPIMTALAQSRTHNDRNLPQIRRNFMQEWQELTEEQIAQLKATLHHEDGTMHEIFVPGCEKEISRLQTLCYSTVVSDFFKDFSASINVTTDRLTKQRDECCDGTLKAQLTKRWSSLLNKRCQSTLMEAGYNLEAYPTRREEARQSNLEILKQVTSSEECMNNLVNQLELDIAPLIHDLVLRYHTVLTSELLQTSLHLQTQSLTSVDWSACIHQLRQHTKTEDEERMVEEFVHLLAWTKVASPSNNADQLPSLSVRGSVNDYFCALQGHLLDDTDQKKPLMNGSVLLAQCSSVTSSP